MTKATVCPVQRLSGSSGRPRERRAVPPLGLAPSDRVEALSIILPLASTFVGAGITYLINVRQRRRTYQEELVNAAIASVAAAEMSVDFLASVGRPVHMTDEDFKQFSSWLVTDGMKAWATKVAQANEALACVLPYKPELAALLPFNPDGTHRGTHTAIISVLRGAGPTRPATLH